MPIQPIHLNFLEMAWYAATAPLPVLRPMASSPTITMKPQQNRQNEVNNEERKAAGGAHFIGEAPDVAQADRRADRGHQETEIGSKAFSFFHCFLSFTDFSRRTRRAWLYLTVKKRRCKWGHTFLNVPVALRRFFFIHPL